MNVVDRSSIAGERRVCAFQIFYPAPTRLRVSVFSESVASSAD